MKRILVLAFTTFVISSCVKSPTGPGGGNTLTNASVVYVVNEGNFGKGNSSLTAYYPDSNAAVTDVFKIVNGRNLGDTGNDIAIFDQKAYIVVNNSDKIEIINSQNASWVGTIYFAAGTSPYRIAIDAQDNLGFVSDLQTNAVSVVNLTTNSLTGDTISVGNNPYGIAYYSGYVFAANSGYGSGNTVSVIDAVSRKVVKTVTVGTGPTEVLSDGSGVVWVVCPGNIGDIGKVYLINTSTLAVVDSINTNAGISAYGGHAFAFDADRGAAYLIADSSVIKLNLTTHQILNDNFISGTFFGMSVDGATGNIFLTDAKDYQSNGQVYIYSPTGTYTSKSFTAGIIPDAMAFQRGF
ncbi:MAG TPA: YncE family protein [Candidatus Kryptonia bacterium]